MHNSRKQVLLLVTFLLIGLGASWIAGQEQKRGGGPAQPPKNLKVLKIDKPEDIRPIMRSFAAGLGVECSFCHEAGDFAKDTENKERARTMIMMVDYLNTNVLTWQGAPKATCYMCHHGQKEPTMTPPAPAPAAVPAAGAEPGRN